MAKETNHQVVITSQVLADAIGILPGEVRVNNPPPKVLEKPNFNIRAARNYQWALYHGSVIRSRDDRDGN